MARVSPTRLSQLFAAHGSALVLYARQWVSPAEAEDAVQDVFLKLMAYGSEPENPAAWLFVAVRNAVLTAARGKRRRQAREQQVAMNRSEMFQTRIEDTVDARLAQQAIETLPPDQRELLVMRIWGGLSYSEMAEVTGRSVTGVFEQYKRGLATIKSKLECPCKTNH